MPVLECETDFKGLSTFAASTYILESVVQGVSGFRTRLLRKLGSVAGVGAGGFPGVGVGVGSRGRSWGGSQGSELGSVPEVGAGVGPRGRSWGGSHRSELGWVPGVGVGVGPRGRSWGGPQGSDRTPDGPSPSSKGSKNRTKTPCL